MNQLPEKYKHIIDQDEIILWHDESYFFDKNRRNIIDSIIAISLILIYLFLLTSHIEYSFYFLIIFLIFFILSPGVLTDFIISKLENNYNDTLSNYYILTENKIHYKNNFSKSFKNQKLENIHQVLLIGTKEIQLKIEPNSKFSEDDTLIKISDINNIESVYELIFKHWFKKSPFKRFIKDCRNIAKKHELYINPFSTTVSKMTMTGHIDGMKILVSISSLRKIESFTIAMKCPNYEDNYLFIKPEDIKSKLKKPIGYQDIRVDTPADEKFIFQSDNKVFFEQVLNPEIQYELIASIKHIKGYIRLGGERKVKSKKENELDINILDEHLFIERKNTIDSNRFENSTLLYHCDNIGSLNNNLGLISEEIDHTLDLVINIARNIQSYQQNNNS